MRKLSLLTYSIYELQKIDINHSLKIMNMLCDAEENNIRLQAPLASWIYLNDKKDIKMGPKMKQIIKDMYAKYPTPSQDNALKFLKSYKNKEFNKFYKSYIAENLRRDDNDFKDEMRELIKTLKKEKNISNYKICKLADVDMGNFHSFYELKKNDKLSKEKVKNIVSACNQLN